jgi:diamine N-acetyltransferase
MRCRTVADVTMIELAEIDDDNLAAVQAVTVSDRQRYFVGTVREALEEAADCPEGNPWYLAVLVDGTVVGFVMLSWNVEPDPPEIIGPWFLWKLIVDQRHQGRGIGAAVVQAVVAIVSAEGASELVTSFVSAEDGPVGFYARLGFLPTDDVDAEGETIVRLAV